MELIHYLTFVAMFEYWTVVNAESSRHRIEKVQTISVARKSKKFNFRVGTGKVYYNHKGRRQLLRGGGAASLTELQGGSSRELSPNLGFEAYWAGGHWVFEDDKSLKDVGMCGQECPPIYVEYGVICAMDKRYTQVTYKNYCEMRNSDCKLRNNWIIAHRGQCISEHFSTHRKWQREIVSSADYLVDKFMKSFPTTFGIFLGNTIKLDPPPTPEIRP